MNKDIASIRRDYQLASLDEASTAEHPMDQFTQWWDGATDSNIDEVNAFVLSTVKANGTPASRRCCYHPSPVACCRHHLSSPSPVLC